MNNSRTFQLLALAPDVWHAQSFLTMPGGAELPIRMTVFRQEDGGLLLYSPIQPQESLIAEVKHKGAVRILLSPNGFHYLYLQSWKKRCPEANIWAAEPVRNKRPDWAIDRLISSDSLPSLGATLKLFFIAGMPKIQEVVLYHLPSRTLALGDLLFNVQDPAWRLGLVMRLMGTYKKPSSSRFYRLFVKEKDVYNQSIQALLQLDVQRLIVAHGEILEGAACHEALKRALL